MHNFKELFYYERGLLFWNSNKIAGAIDSDGYLVTTISGKRHYNHRIIWEMLNGQIPENHYIDHIDGVRTNNSIENLRLATRSQNLANSKISKNNKCGFKGVSLDKANITKPYRSQIRINGKTVNLGNFKTPELAHKAYIDSANAVFKEFARYN